MSSPSSLPRLRTNAKLKVFKLENLSKLLGFLRVHACDGGCRPLKLVGASAEDLHDGAETIVV